MRYHVWTAGCQMNVADSQRVASTLEKLGYQATEQAENADIIVLNTCVVRQSAEDKAHGRLTSLKPLKERNPDLVINLMGCMVGVRGSPELQATYPFVDVFSPPSDPLPLVNFILHREGKQLEEQSTLERFAVMDGDLTLPDHELGQLVSAHIPIVYGCSHACTFCVIPFRRGVERSRMVGEIVSDARALVDQGVKELTLLGQIVDRYGMDISDGPRLVNLLEILNDLPGLERIRFLTSHPNWMQDDLLHAVAELPKVCEHIEVPVQAGDDQILEQMRRGYRSEDYYRLIERIRDIIPNVSIATDIIVGFPGESDQQFQRTYDLLSDLKLDVAHLARYSPRPQTVSSRRMEDDVPDEEKMRRFRSLEELQTQVATEINTGYLGRTVEVLVEEKHKDRWKGRTRTNKLVFFESADNHHAQVLPVKIQWTGPWSMRGTLVRDASPADAQRELQIS
ncbi:MAG: tRNA (N6-isopentenyl adenosine(37)-C2)-methylthiotransferase MiaB [Anaerolineales bacterium]|nr:MAG: tRNA (N6-isopentenyl adenosine(37)-C2)-methylthiotransferase MiaB [Anaerolineales bacterium]